MFVERKAVADPSGPKQYGIKEVLVRFIAISQTFACMKEERTVLIDTSVLPLKIPVNRQVSRATGCLRSQ